MKQKRELTLSAACFLMALLCTAVWLGRKNEDLADRISPALLRFHVLANSNSRRDQELKAGVKSLLLEELNSVLAELAENASGAGADAGASLDVLTPEPEPVYSKLVYGGAESQSGLVYDGAELQSDSAYGSTDSWSGLVHSSANFQSDPIYSSADSRSNLSCSSADSWSGPAYRGADIWSDPVYNGTESRSKLVYGGTEPWSDPAYGSTDSRSASPVHDAPGIKSALCEYITLHCETLEAQVSAYLRGRGCSDPVRIEIARSHFPTKYYGDIMLPAGTYDTVKVTLGQGRGRNWWCLLYPRLCFLDAACAVVPEESKTELQVLLDEEDYEALIDDRDQKICVRFRLLDWLLGV